MEVCYLLRQRWLYLSLQIPDEPKKGRKAAADFRKHLIEDGFTMFQFSIYVRHCASMENADVHLKRIRGLLPEYGKVCQLCITDKQFSKIEIFHGQKKEKPQTGPIQLELF